MIGFIGADPVGRERIVRHFRSSPGWCFEFCDGVPAELNAALRRSDVIVLPAELFLANTGECRAADRPVLPYGAAQLLSPCFLAGCCDYLRDGFGLDELFHRLAGAMPLRPFRWNGAMVTLERCAIRCGSGSELLSWSEYRVLQTLLRNRGLAVARETLYQAFSERERANSRAIDMHVSNLRSKLNRLAGRSGREAAASQLQSVRGIGYRLVVCE